MELDQIKSSFEANFPSQQIEFTILESDATSVLFEAVIGKGNPLMYLVGPAFSTKEGSTMLMYQTGDAATLEANRSICVEALKGAKLQS